MNFNLENIKNVTIDIPNTWNLELVLKREDAIHDFVSGNKYRKLKYNILEAQKEDEKTLLTFGGAFSNHIAAVASLGQLYGFKTIGVIRGDELESQINNNATLWFAKQCGMEFRFVSRTDYKLKTTPAFLDDLKHVFGDFYLIPEGGTNALAIQGCEEILTKNDKEHFDFVCTAVGTGGTISGIINSSGEHQQILGFPALKGDFLSKDISKFVTKSNWQLITDYHFGGYAKVNSELISFINRFKSDFNVPLDPVYTGKMMFGICHLIEKGFFPKHSKILAIHTGGLQGIEGMNALLKKKNLQTIN